MRLEEAWIPIDEVAGTAVDTFSQSRVNCR